MKKLIFPAVLMGCAGVLFAAQPTVVNSAQSGAKSPITTSATKPVAVFAQKEGEAVSLVVDAEEASRVSARQSEKEIKKEFESRRKLIKKLVKKYHKAADKDKPAVKAELTQVVSVSMDKGLLMVKERISAQRANLDRWSAKLAEEEENFVSVKAQRVEDLLSGDAERKHKQAQKEWKKELREAKEHMQ